MWIKPLKDADHTKVIIKNNTPHCKYHGAMNRLTKEIWRCVSTYKVENIFTPQEKFKANNCNAGCVCI